MHLKERDVGERTGLGRAFSSLRVVTAVVLLAAVGVGAGAAAREQRDRLVGYRSPFHFELRPGAATPPLTERVVLVVIDGLRQDVARDLPTMRRLGAAGAFLVAGASEPSFDVPAWAQLLTGAPPDISGVTTDRYRGPLVVDSLFREAALNGLATAVAADLPWAALFGEWVAEGWYAQPDPGIGDARVGAEAVRLLREVEPAFLVVHLSDVDHVAHLAGVGPEYAAVARRADRVVASVAAAAGPEATVVVTSTQGHVDEGGHGGPEPEVLSTPLILSGSGIRRTGPATVLQADVAPTIAALLGLPRPSHALGRPLSVLDGDPATLAEIAVAHRDVATRFSTRAARAVGREATGLASFQRARQEEERSAIRIRAPLVLAFLVAGAMALWVATRRLDVVAVLGGTGALLGTWVGLFVGRGLTLSLSAVGSEDQVGSLLASQLVDVAVAGVVGGAVAGLLAGRRSDPFRNGLGVVASSLFVMGVAVALVFTRHGWPVPGRLPDLSASLGGYLGLRAMAALGVGAAGVGLASMAAAGLRARRVAGVD